jgi:signal transduction histidine kinase
VARILTPLIGLEAEIKALQSGQVLRLPSEELTLMVVAPAQLDTTLTLELSRQMRGRLMAETEAAAKSQELARANADLKIANSNLEQFAAIATHDLKAPMRALGYLADEIESAMTANDGDRAKQKLAELRGQASRVSFMLSALLHYSGAGRSNAAIESVDVRELIEEIVRSLPRGTVVVTLQGDWPRLDTLAAPLGLALRNLIDNTIKHHDRPQGRLLIACADAGEALEITLADDGPGIAPEHHASMFLPFRTLGTGGEGMGLAMCRKCSTPSAAPSLCSRTRRASAARPS